MNYIKTSLYEEHDKLGAKIIPFAGYLMPVSYNNGLIAEYNAVRLNVGMFDVSHMGQLLIEGSNAEQFLNYVTVNNVNKIQAGGAQYSAFCNKDGKVIDDIIVYSGYQNAAALLGMECCVYMGEVDIERQKLNVFRMQLLGAEVRSALSGSRTLKDAINEAMRDWVATVEDSHYCLGSVMGPHPYPWMVRTFHEVLGKEARVQSEERLGEVPDFVVACVGGGSNAIGIFSGFADSEAQLVGVEPSGGAAVGRGVPGVVHGSRSFLMQDEFGQVLEAESISAGLDYPGVGPEHSYLADSGRARYESVTDQEVVEAFQLLSRTEGIIPALEPAHALAWISRERESLKGKTVLLNLSGRGDKDVAQMMEVLRENKEDD